MVEWSPREYILRGTYCPTDDLAARLRNDRDHYGLSVAAVFTVCDADHTQEPFVVHEFAGGFAAAAEPVLLGLSHAGDELHRAVAEAVFLAEPDHRDARLAEVAATIAARLGSDLPDGARVVLTTPQDMQSNSPVRPVALTVGPQLIAPERLELLYAMLVTNVQVRQAIDRAALSPLDELLLIPPVRADGGIDLPEVTRRALDRAVRYTGSEQGVIHWHTPHGTDAGSDPAEVAAILDDLDGDPSTVLAGMHTINRADHYAGRKGVVLACPIPGVLAGPQSPAAGVLLLRRAGQTPYSSHALARCRAICIRLAVVRVTADASEVVRLIMDLSTPSPAAAVRGARGAYRSDLELALDGLTPMLERIARMTNSQSVTLRLARGVMDSSDDHGLVLERATTAPTPDPDVANRLSRQSETVDRGLNWLAVRTGRPVAAADVTVHDEYYSLRRETRSQLSLPVRMGTRVVGTLNLESASMQNYGTFEPYGRLVADAVGRRLAAASMIVSQPVIERAAQVLDRTHSYRNKLVRLRDDSLNLPLDERDRERVVAYVDECIGLIDSAVQAPSPPGGAEPELHDTTRLLVGKVVQHHLETTVVHGLDHVNHWADVAAFNRTLPAPAVRAVGDAVHGILGNIKKHVHARYGGPPPTVWFGECTWDGTPHAVIVFTNPTDTTLPPDIAAQVYRTPVQRSGVRGQLQLQLGAYLTGLAVRPANGWVTFAVDDGQARTVLLVPVPQEENVA